MYVNTCDSVYPPSHLRLLLLLSGDVELNPGPITAVIGPGLSLISPDNSSSNLRRRIHTITSVYIKS